MLEADRKIEKKIILSLSPRLYEILMKTLDTHRKGILIAQMNPTWKLNLLADVKNVEEIIRKSNKGGK